MAGDSRCDGGEYALRFRAYAVARPCLFLPGRLRVIVSGS